MADTTFENFMDPSIDWYAPNAYLEAFVDLVVPAAEEEQTMAEAGYTPTDGSHPPPYANIKFDAGKATVTVRSAPLDADGHHMEGPQAAITMDIADFDVWIANVLRERQRA